MSTLKQYTSYIGYEGELDLQKIKDWALKENNWIIQDNEDEEDMTVEEWMRVEIDGKIKYLGV